MTKPSCECRRAASGCLPVLRFADLGLDIERRTAFRGERRIELTTREYELLALFLRNPGRVLARAMIFELIWGHALGPRSNLLDVYIGYLRHKLEQGGESRLIRTMRGAGYVLWDGDVVSCQAEAPESPLCRRSPAGRRVVG